MLTLSMEELRGEGQCKGHHSKRITSMRRGGVEADLSICAMTTFALPLPLNISPWPLFFSPLRSESIASCRAGSVLSVASRRSRHEGTSVFNPFLHLWRSNMTWVTFMSHTLTHFFTFKGQIWPQWLLCPVLFLIISCGAGPFGSKQQFPF